MKVYVTAARHSPTGRVFSEVTKVEEVENHRLELVPVLSQTTSQHLSKLGAWYPHGRDGVATLAMHANRFISIKTLGNGLCCLKIMVAEWKIDKKNWCTICSAVTQQSWKNVRIWDRTLLPTSHFRTLFGSDIRRNLALSVRIRIEHGQNFGPISVRIRIGHRSA